MIAPNEPAPPSFRATLENIALIEEGYQAATELDIDSFIVIIDGRGIALNTRYAKYLLEYLKSISP